MLPDIKNTTPLYVVVVIFAIQDVIASIFAIEVQARR